MMIDLIKQLIFDQTLLTIGLIIFIIGLIAYLIFIRRFYSKTVKTVFIPLSFTIVVIINSFLLDSKKESVEELVLRVENLDNTYNVQNNVLIKKLDTIRHYIELNNSILNLDSTKIAILISLGVNLDSLNVANVGLVKKADSIQALLTIREAQMLSNIFENSSFRFLPKVQKNIFYLNVKETNRVLLDLDEKDMDGINDAISKTSLILNTEIL